MALSKGEKKQLKREYLTANPDVMKEMEVKYVNLGGLSLNDFTVYDDADLEMHIINFINFGLLGKTLTTRGLLRV